MNDFKQIANDIDKLIRSMKSMNLDTGELEKVRDTVLEKATGVVTLRDDDLYSFRLSYKKYDIPEEGKSQWMLGIDGELESCTICLSDLTPLIEILKQFNNQRILDI